MAASKCRKKRKEHVKTLVEVIIQFAVFTLTSDRNLGMINDDLVSSYCRLACSREVGKKTRISTETMMHNFNNSTILQFRII